MSDVLIGEWQALHDETPLPVRERLFAFIDEHAGVLAEYFYSQMLIDPGTGFFLSHKQVEDRLKPSMELWLRRIFDASPDTDIEALFALQRHVGEVHARIGVPVEFVARGARRLTTRIIVEYGGVLTEHAEWAEAARFVTDSIGIPLEVMASAYSGSYEVGARADEAYRLFSTGQNLQVERERQRAALLAWETQFLYWVSSGCSSADTPLVAESEFGLWMHHKGATVFQGAEERAGIEREVTEIDTVLLPMLRLSRKRSSEALDTIHAVKNHAAQLRFLLTSLFECLASLDAGRDVLTQLLNRRFLDVILARENRLARTSGSHSFAVMMVDIDHFKRVNDQYGHQAGDLVLQHTASLLLNAVRAGDYVFRYGGEEFTVVLVEVDLVRAQVIAEKVRARIAGEAARLPDGKELRLEVSIGVACFEGHPDPMRTLERADKALLRAKEGGRNRVELG